MPPRTSPSSSSPTDTQAAARAITPELREWIIAQAQAGFAGPVVLQSMLDAGWSEDVATYAMEHVLRAHLDGLDRARGKSAAAPDTAPDSTATAAPAVPEDQGDTAGEYGATECGEPDRGAEPVDDALVGTRGAADHQDECHHDRCGALHGHQQSCGAHRCRNTGIGQLRTHQTTLEHMHGVADGHAPVVESRRWSRLL